MPHMLDVPPLREGRVHYDPVIAAVAVAVFHAGQLAAIHPGGAARVRLAVLVQRLEAYTLTRHAARAPHHPEITLRVAEHVAIGEEGARLHLGKVAAHQVVALGLQQLAALSGKLHHIRLDT
ncbi:hypothetical protein D3C72_570880 [compost metagenome]